MEPNEPVSVWSIPWSFGGVPVVCFYGGLGFRVYSHCASRLNRQFLKLRMVAMASSSVGGRMSGRKIGEYASIVLWTEDSSSRALSPEHNNSFTL